MPTRLPSIPEALFQSWYRGILNKRNELGMPLNPDPDDPNHFYDYRGAYAAGAQMSHDGHFSSEFKLPGNERMILGGVPTQEVGQYRDLASYLDPGQMKWGTKYR